MPRRPRSLAGRTVLVTAATTVIAVLMTGTVGVLTAVRTVNLQVRTDLQERAAFVAALLAREPAGSRAAVVAGLRAEGVEIYLIRRGEPDRPGLPDRVVKQVAAGRSVDAFGLVDGRPSFAGGRPFPTAAGGPSPETGGQPFPQNSGGGDTPNDDDDNAGPRNSGDGIVLTRTVSSGTAARALGGLWLALLAGLAGGIAAGALLARVVVRPVEQAAAAAGRLSAGDRSVRLSRTGPTEAVRLADAFDQLTEALQTSEGREREFLLSVSHELRTPLATIRGYAEALADGVIAGDGTTEAGRTVLGEAERLDRLISDLLVLSRLEAADLPIDVLPVDLVELVREAGRAWRSRCGDGGPVLTVETPSGPVVVDTDPGRIRQVLDGLCENALRVVPAGAPLVLAVRAGTHGAILEVRDGGPGFTDDDLAVAFQRGELNRRYRGVRAVGSGLGLALAARLVTRLGGVIEAGHAPEGGAMFTVELPLASG
ncbi:MULTISPECIES: HAMP domain-containing sensor histidine kinase [Actinoplanes]|uniref:sensor histidine kinase n=1 Tax=Actinoplanes TaxID=1865 RepID=UPI0005F2F50B|nr:MULTISPECIES: HAMP domain-containing sensor histidine kinase [Actinoplanes]GLY06045.1 two-component sensor histidine kinase [Actinoplanes sp. NBRC 101535]